MHDTINCKKCGLTADLELGMSCLGMIDSIYFDCPRCEQKISYREKHIVENVKWQEFNSNGD